MSLHRSVICVARIAGCKTVTERHCDVEMWGDRKSLGVTLIGAGIPYDLPTAVLTPAHPSCGGESADGCQASPR
jgi:hypothetical protein